MLGERDVEEEWLEMAREDKGTVGVSFQINHQME